jgi:type I restriction enzyme S subunit
MPAAGQVNDNLEAQATTICGEFFASTDDRTIGVLSDICHFSKERVRLVDLSRQTYLSTENILPDKKGYVDAASLPTTESTTAFFVGDVLVSNIRPYYKKIVYCFFNGGCSTDVLCFQANNPAASAFLYYTLYNDKFFQHVEAGYKGTKMPRGDKKQIMEYKIATPSESELSAFSQIILPILQQKSETSRELNKLRILAETMLTQLSSHR